MNNGFRAAGQLVRQLTHDLVQEIKNAAGPIAEKG
jgi:hypothetical protein